MSMDYRTVGSSKVQIAESTFSISGCGWDDAHFSASVYQIERPTHTVLDMEKAILRAWADWLRRH